MPVGVAVRCTPTGIGGLWTQTQFADSTRRRSRQSIQLPVVESTAQRTQVFWPRGDHGHSDPHRGLSTSRNAVGFRCISGEVSPTDPFHSISCQHATVRSPSWFGPRR